MNYCGYEIPNKFELANQIITVIFKDKGTKFGAWDDLHNTITLYKSVYHDDENEYIPLSDSQILNSYFHELIHAMCFFYDNSSSEAVAQSFGNLLQEYVISKQN